MGTSYTAKGDEFGNPLPYKVYTALLTQTGTDAPVPVILEKTLIGNLTFVYDSVGNFLLVSDTNTFTENKSIAFIQPNIAGNYKVRANRQSDTEFIINTRDEFGEPTNGLLIDTPIEIRVYN